MSMRPLMIGEGLFGIWSTWNKSPYIKEGLIIDINQLSCTRIFKSLCIYEMNNSKFKAFSNSQSWYSQECSTTLVRNSWGPVGLFTFSRPLFSAHSPIKELPSRHRVLNVDPRGFRLHVPLSHQQMNMNFASAQPSWSW